MAKQFDEYKVKLAVMAIIAGTEILRDEHVLTSIPPGLADLKALLQCGENTVDAP